MNLDALARVTLQYIKDRDGQTILKNDIAEDTGMNIKTVRKKVNFLTENGFIRCEGKKFFVIPRGE